jgi:hypothetical protein
LRLGQRPWMPKKGPGSPVTGKQQPFVVSQYDPGHCATPLRNSSITKPSRREDQSKLRSRPTVQVRVSCKPPVARRESSRSCCRIFVEHSLFCETTSRTRIASRHLLPPTRTTPQLAGNLAPAASNPCSSLSRRQLRRMRKQMQITGISASPLRISKPLQQQNSNSLSMTTPTMDVEVKTHDLNPKPVM